MVSRLSLHQRRNSCFIPGLLTICPQIPADATLKARSGWRRPSTQFFLTFQTTQLATAGACLSTTLLFLSSFSFPSLSVLLSPIHVTFSLKHTCARTNKHYGHQEGNFKSFFFSIHNSFYKYRIHSICYNLLYDYRINILEKQFRKAEVFHVHHA